VVGDGVAERLGRSLREGHGGGEEARRAREVRVVRRGQERRAVQIKLTERRALFVAPQLFTRDGARFDDAGRG
jgi:hypothetical protein